MYKKLPPVIIGILNRSFIFLLFFSLSITAQNPKIKCYFNHPVNNAVSTGTNAIYLNGTFVDTTVAYINRSKYSLDIAVFNYTYGSGDGLDAIANAVNAAANRGVVCRWINDGASTNSGMALLNSNVQTLGSPTSTSYGIMHNKFMIIDANSSNTSDPIVWTGSYNFSRNQADVDFNNIIIFQDKPMALAFTSEFNQMWGSTGPIPNSGNSNFGPNKTASSQNIFNVNGTTVEVYFSPKDNTRTHLQNTMSTVNNDLFFGIFTFTDTIIANQIKGVKNSGLTVKGIMDVYSQLYDPYSILNPVLGSNMEMYTSTGTYHNKIMLVDAGITGSDPTVFTGSFNWTISANTKNDENAVVIHDANIANQYYQSLCRDLSDMGGPACSLVGMENFDLADQQLAVFPNPVKDIVNVKIRNAGSGMKVKITSVLGETIREINITASNEAQLDLRDLANGLYILRVTRDGATLSTRLVKQ